MKKLTKKKAVIIGSSCLCAVLAAAGCFYMYTGSRFNSKVYLYGNNSVNLVTSSGNTKELIQGCNITHVDYYEDLKRYAAVDDTNTMYMVTLKGENKKMAEDVMYRSIKNPDTERLYFIGTDNKLYFKKEIGTKQQVKEEDINDYFIINEQERMYINKNKTLFYYKYGDNTYKIKDNVTDLKLSEEKDKAAFISSGSLYMGKVSDDNPSKVSDSSDVEGFEFISNDDLVFTSEYSETDENTKNYTLNIKENGSESRIISENVSSYVISYEDKDNIKIYYITDDGKLECFSKKDDKKEITENIKEIVISEDNTVYALAEDSILYKINSKDEAEKEAENVKEIKAGKSKAVYLSSDNVLYSGDKKISEGVEKFEAAKGDIAYTTSAGEVYIAKERSGSAECLGKTSDYNKICIEDKVLYRPDISEKDFLGYWKTENKETGFKEYYNFSENGGIEYMDFNNYGFKNNYIINNSDENKAEIIINSEKVTVEVLADGRLKMKYADGTIKEFDRITEDDYEDAENIISRVNKKAFELNKNTEFEKSMEVNDTEYYLYKNEENIYLNAYGEKFAYNEETDAMNPII